MTEATPCPLMQRNPAERVLLGYKKVGLGKGQTFTLPARPAWSQRVDVFLAASWEAEPAETRVMVPAWSAVDAIPFDPIWHDARYWLSPTLDRQRLRARFRFGEDSETVSAFVIEPRVEAACGEED